MSTKKCRQAKHGIMPGETLAANGDTAVSRLPPAPAESGKPEGDANEESDTEINRRREGGKRAANWLAGQQGQQHEHLAPKSNTKTDGSDAAGGQASPAAFAAQHSTQLGAMSWEYVRNSPLNNTMQRKKVNTIH